MFKALLSFHWKVARSPLLLASVAAFTVPLLSVQRFGWNAGVESDSAMMLGSMSSFAGFYPIIAAACGLLVAMTAWSKDHRLNHVYALTLPIDRWRYVLLRYRAGLTLLALPVAALSTGALLAGTGMIVPDGLSIYPFALTLRFGLAAGVAFSLFFAISAGTSKTAGYILGGLLALVGFQTVMFAVGVDVNLVDDFVTLMLEWPGPFDVFTGRWMLIDV